MEALPTVTALHRAPMAKVLALWSGLGYYRRAVNLKKAVRTIIDDHRGDIPQTYDSLRSLPGVGDYTAGAIMSIAFQRPFPAVDGNARRVLERLFVCKTEPELRRFAWRIVSRSRPGDFNQALMELGATICLPGAPNCRECPLDYLCAQRQLLRTRHSPGPATPKRSQGRSALDISVTPKKTTRLRIVSWPLAAIRHRGKLLLRRRSGQGILAGLWELPGGERSKSESVRGTLKRYLNELHGGLKAEGRIGEFRHTITNRRICAPIFLFTLEAPLRLPRRQWRWCSPNDLGHYPVSAMTHKAIKLLKEHDQSFD
jgi:A/G-specific adenine glycosylase